MVVSLPIDPLGGAIGAAERQRRAGAFDPTRAWVNGDSYNLSDRVWLARQSVRQAIDRTLVNAIVSGEDSLLTARKLEQWLSSSWAPRRDERGRLVARQPKRLVTQTPGRAGAWSFASRRLARTEISRAHALATIQSAQANPFTRGVRWMISGNHPNADRCDQHARRDSGFGPGIYRVQDFPSMPEHPHCRCVAVPVPVEDTRSVVARLRQAYGLDMPTIPVGANAPTPLRALRRLVSGLFAALSILRGLSQ